MPARHHRQREGGLNLSHTAQGGNGVGGGGVQGGVVDVSKGCVAVQPRTICPIHHGLFLGDSIDAAH